MLRTWLVKSWRSLKPWHCNHFCGNFVTCSTLSFVSYKVRQTRIVLVLFVTCMECLLGSFVTNVFEKSDVTIRIPSLVSLGAQILCGLKLWTDRSGYFLLCGLKLLMWLSFLGDSEAYTSIYQICVCAVRLETRSRVQPPLRSATLFRGDWSWNIFYCHSLPSADLRRAVVSFWQKNVHSTG